MEDKAKTKETGIKLKHYAFCKDESMDVGPRHENKSDAIIDANNHKRIPGKERHRVDIYDVAED